MKVVYHQSRNSKIEIVELVGGLNGSGAVELKNWLYERMDKNGCKDYSIINLERVKKIDGLGIDVLEHFVSRGVDIHLFNVGLEIKWMLNMAGKKDILKRIYNEANIDRALSKLENEILKKGETTKKGVKMRRCPHVNTFFPVDFKYYPGNNGAILCSAKVLNLSESGLFAGKLSAVDLTKKKAVNRLDIVGQKFYDIKFKIEEGSKKIETKGEYVWKKEVDGTLGIGIRFKDIKQEYKEIIRDYAFDVFSTPSKV